jgi:putative ATP-dependent endonuclease of OLD family
MKINKIEISNYDCFQKDDWIVFDNNVLFTVVIGRNNAGKTFFTKLLEKAFTKNDNHPAPFTYEDETPKIRANVTIEDDDLLPTFSKNGRSFLNYGVYSPTDFERAEQLLNGKRMIITFSSDGTMISSAFVDGAPNDQLIEMKIDNFGENLKTKLIKSLLVTKFVRINSERDIGPEKENEKAELEPNGDGATSIIEFILHNEYGKDRLITNDLLRSLNNILGVDGGFSEISAKRKNGVYQIFLLESGKDESLPLSQLGSGIKTIVHVLLTLLTNTTEKNTVFCFEELENSLHPSLQRNLFDYLYTYSEEHKQKIIVTTHSSVPLNIVLGKENTQVIHITKTNNVSHAETITDFSSSKNVLDDLGIKASDILQTNGIIWVEGPSDRAYIEKWLSLFGCKYKEGVHYSYLYTGGKNLANYSASEDQDKLIKMLLVNRNAILVSDRDEADGSTPLDGFKQRIVKELTSKGLHCWVTDGREIENYLKDETVKKLYPEYSGTKGEYDDFGSAISNVYKSFEDNKKHFAERITEKMKTEDLDILKLKTRIKNLNDLIEVWNTPSARKQ